MEIDIRYLQPSDQTVLWTMLHHALYVPPGSTPPPIQIVFQESLRKYAEGWGQANDVGLIAIAGEQVVGACWCRLLTGAQRGYGYIDDETPELAMAVLPAFRSAGIGTRLLAELLALAQRRFTAVSLSVAETNPVRRLYLRNGFVKVRSEGSSSVMVKHFA